jgi:predicted unusual protein kinase regulating ubiquinone biosynthesis (AarF/ABC1/UbiB family)
MYDFPFRVPAYYALIIRSLLTLEGIAIGLDPNFKVLSVAYPYVAQRLLTDPAPGAARISAGAAV